MKTMRFVMLGGFLGAGKTTALARLARHYMDRGLKVGLVTNDQAQNLVDTNNLRSQGFAVAEVAGACFCCKFDDLVASVSSLEAGERPDVILAEPVGSCTDLVATVIRPLMDLHRARFEVAPYAVLFKPGHGLRILRGEGGGFSPKAAYIFRKQLEEADAIVINRIDEIGADELKELDGLLAAEYPGVPVLKLSAKTGAGFEALPELLGQSGAFGRKLLDIDYDIYAEGEAEMGWLNASAGLSADSAVPLDPLLMAVISGLHGRIHSLGGEVAHLKVIGMEEGGAFGVANLVSSAGEPEFALKSNANFRTADLIVNARVAMDPDVLSVAVRQVVGAAAEERGIRVEFRQTQSLRPGRPVPTHRYAAAG